MGSAGLSPRIKIENPYSRRALADIAVAGMSSVVRGRFDVENLATQLVTDAAAVGMQQQRTQPMSDDYHQSKKASRCAGQITQTAIEQQWENQLINDEHFITNAFYIKKNKKMVGINWNWINWIHFRYGLYQRTSLTIQYPT